LKIISIFPDENNNAEDGKPERPPKRPFLDIALRLVAIFIMFFTLSFVGTHFLGDKYHPTNDPMPAGPSIVVATVVGLVMTIYLAKSV
jgi:hypothetical protein